MPQHFHKDDDYLDPESDEWNPPSVPVKDELPVNAHNWGAFYRWQGPVPRQQSVISVAITREIHPPWHRGLGLVIRWDRPSQPFGYAIGIWKKGKPPRILSQEPTEKNLQLVVERANRLDKLAG